MIQSLEVYTEADWVGSPIDRESTLTAPMYGKT